MPAPGPILIAKKKSTVGGTMSDKGILRKYKIVFLGDQSGTYIQIQLSNLTNL